MNYFVAVDSFCGHRLGSEVKFDVAEHIDDYEEKQQCQKECRNQCVLMNISDEQVQNDGAEHFDKGYTNKYPGCQQSKTDKQQVQQCAFVEDEYILDDFWGVEDQEIEQTL